MPGIYHRIYQRIYQIQNISKNIPRGISHVGYPGNSRDIHHGYIPGKFHFNPFVYYYTRFGYYNEIFSSKHVTKVWLRCMWLHNKINKLTYLPYCPSDWVVGVAVTNLNLWLIYCIQFCWFSLREVCSWVLVEITLFITTAAVQHSLY